MQNKAQKALRDLWRRIGRYQAYIENYTRASHASPDPALAYVNWGIDLAQEGKLGESLEKFEQAAAISANRPEPFNNWGVALARQGRLQEATDKFQQALAVDPESVHSYILWGAALLELGDIDGAREKYEKAVQLNPANPEPYVNWGIALSRMGRYQEAIRHFQAALAIYSYQPQVYFLWGAVLAELEQYEQAIEKFQLTLRHMPQHPEAYYFWAIALNRLGRYEEAIEKSRKALERDAQNPEIYLNLGDALANRGQYELAIENYKQAAILDPDMADTLMSWGSALCKLGRYEEGYAQFEKALAVDSLLTEVHYFWGASLNANRRYTEALPHLQQVYEAHPEHLDNLINYGLAQIHTGQADAGYALLKAAEKQDDGNPQVHFLLGTQQLSQGNTKTAKEHLQKALDAKKDFTDAAINLSLALCELGDTQEAVRTLRPFMRQHQNSAEVHFFYGTILYRHGDLKDARQKYERALELRPGYVEALLGLAEIALQQNALEEAKTALTTLLTYQPEFIPALYLSGMVFSRLAETQTDPALQQIAWEQARPLYEHVIQLNPNHIEARVNLAYLLGQQGHRTQMDTAFEGLLDDPHLSRSQILEYWAKALEAIGDIDAALQCRYMADDAL